MANPLFDMLKGQMSVQPQIRTQTSAPFQRFNMLMQAIRNPQAFAKEAFPDIPDNISGDPNQILQYLQRTRNVSNEQIQNIMNQFPHF